MLLARKEIPDAFPEIIPCFFVQTRPALDDPRLDLVARGWPIPHIGSIDRLNQRAHFVVEIRSAGKGMRLRGQQKVRVQTSFVVQEVEPADPGDANPKEEWNIDQPEEADGQRRS